MRSMALTPLVAALAPAIASAHVVRHSSIPQAYWGTWTTHDGGCGDTGKAAVVLSASRFRARRSPTRSHRFDACS